MYQARYGWDRKTAGLVALSVVFTAILLLPDTPLIARILGLPLFGGGGLFLAFAASSRKVALRVDETGVLLGGSPARYAATTDHVPWGDITGVVLWRQAVSGASLSHVGVSRREGAPPLRGGGPRARAAVRFLVPVPVEVALASRGVNGWRLDKDRLVTAVAHFAPDIAVHDLR